MQKGKKRKHYKKKQKGNTRGETLSKKCGNLSNK